MDKIKLDKIVVDNTNFKDLFIEYLKLKLSVKDSDIKLKDLHSFISEDIFNKYKELKDNNSNELNNFLLDNPLLGEFIDENIYNIYINDQLEYLLEKRIDLLRLSNGIDCHHEFIKLNNKLLCIKCFIKEEELDYHDEELCEFLVEVAKAQGMYIDEIDESELGLLEKVKIDHKNLINKLKKQRNNLPVIERNNIDETIDNLETNKTIEYRKSLKKLRKNKLSI